jgi:glyoxylase-like metal-dependent hydrolase (beta-lactamase superfamily II)
MHVLVTHADFDHVGGIPYVPDAVVVAGEATAARIRSGEAGRDLVDAGREWGVDWLDSLRVDRVVPPGETACGVFRVEAIVADGHTADGLAYVLVEQGVLVAGDYLSGMTYPFLGGSLEAAIATHRRLLDALDRHELRWVVPGHGAPLPPAEARSVGEADLAYLQALAAAVAEARERDLPPGPALLHVFAVEPPRPTTLDFELYGLRAANARAVLGDA